VGALWLTLLFFLLYFLPLCVRVSEWNSALAAAVVDAVVAVDPRRAVAVIAVMVAAAVAPCATSRVTVAAHRLPHPTLA
jgi:hypothetical protein